MVSRGVSEFSVRSPPRASCPATTAATNTAAARGHRRLNATGRVTPAAAIAVSPGGPRSGGGAAGRGGGGGAGGGGGGAGWTPAPPHATTATAASIAEGLGRPAMKG